MTLLQTSQSSWQNKMVKKDVIVKPNRTSRLSVILYRKWLSSMLDILTLCLLDMHYFYEYVYLGFSLLIHD